jgi:hypothetical protein
MSTPLEGICPVNGSFKVFVLSAAAMGVSLFPDSPESVAARARYELADSLPQKQSAEFALAAQRAMLDPGYRKRELGLDYDGAKPNSHFYSWMVVPTWGQGVAFFSVDRRTADVWAHLGCRRVQSPELAALQTNFRRRFKVSAAQVRAIEREGFPGDC